MFTHLVLELCGVSSVHWHGCAIHVEFPHDASTTFCTIFMDKFWAKRPFLGAFSQPKETNEDVPLRILIRKEGLPAAIRGIVSAQ
jgi:hypothetical protein